MLLVNIDGQKAAIVAQVGHFYSGAVGQFYIGANTRKNLRELRLLVPALSRWGLLEDPRQ